MPILGIWSQYCPPNLEATSITIFTGMMNFSKDFASYLGALLVKLLKMRENDF